MTVTPPSGFRFACQLFSLSQRDLDRTGQKISEFELEPDEGFSDRQNIEQKIDQLKVEQVLKDAVQQLFP